MKKIQNSRLNTLISIFDAGIYQAPIQPPRKDEILSCFLELKQLRAEKQYKNNDPDPIPV